MAFDEKFKEFFNTSRPGFYWSANTPYLRSIWVRVFRTPKGTAGAIGPVLIDTRHGRRTVNPASIIYECMANDTWSIGCPDDLIDFGEFASSATQLYNEGFGMALSWTNESTAEDFINIILDHIDGYFFVHPRTGKHTLRLARDNYDRETLRVVNPDNARMVSLQWRAWGETTNEMKVTWTNPLNEKEETVILQDLGNIAQQGAVVSASKNYFGVRDKDLAMTLCARELRKAASPSISCEMMLLRDAWDVVPGDVVKLVWPDYEIVESVMRIAEVDYGMPGDPYIRVKMSEDVFSLSQAKFEPPPDTEWVDPSQPPTPLIYNDVLTLPAYLVGTLAEQDVSQTEYPEVLAGVLAANDNTDTSSFDLLVRAVEPNGTISWENDGQRHPCGMTLLPVALGQEATSLIPSFSSIVGLTGPAASALMLVGDGPVEDRELMMISSVDENGYHIDRGVLDTVPKEWPAGSRVWFIAPTSAFRIVDYTVRSDGETVEYKLLSTTSKGTLDETDAPIVSATLNGRPHYPSRPADVKVGGVAFGELAAAGVTEIPVTWANRNRLTEDSVILPWTAGDVTPEAGQTTTVIVTDLNDNVLAEHTGLTGTSFNLPISSFGTEYEGYVAVGAERDGLESLQAHRIKVNLVPPGAMTTEAGDFILTEGGDFMVKETGDFDMMLPVVNGDAETGDLTGWTVTEGNFAVNNASTYVHSGSYSFFGGSSTAESRAHQDVILPGAVNPGVGSLLVDWWQCGYTGTTDRDAGEVIVTFLDGEDTAISSAASGLETTYNAEYVNRRLSVAIPAGAVKVRIELHSVRYDGTACNIYYDDIRVGVLL